MQGGVVNGVVRINSFDVAANTIDVQSIFLEGAAFAIAEYPAHPSAATLKKKPVRPDTTAAVGNPLRAFVGRLYLKDSKFSLDRFDVSPARQTPDNVLDYEHLAVQDIAIEADSIFADADLVFSGRLRHLAAREQSGLEVKHLESNQVFVNDTLTALYGMRLETNGSVLSDTLALRYRTYRDYNAFTNRVTLEGRFAPDSKIRLGDVMFFSPNVETNSFFNKNRDLVADLTGTIDGRINRLNGRNLHLRVGDELFIAGNFDGNDMAEGSDRIRLLFDLEQANTNMRTLRRVLPGFDAPEYFDILGNVNFKGTYQILFGTNHILNGDLSSEIGFGKVDMKLDLGGGAEKATYSGYLNMNDFDIAAWTGSSEFGKSTFRVNIADGSGLTLKTIKTRLSGVVDSFYFRGYNYQNVELNGRFDQSVFDGRVNMEDPNIDFTFDGSVNFKDSIPEFDFKADLRRLDLGALNLVEKDWVVSGNIQKIKLFARDFNDLRGAVVLRNFLIVQDKKYQHRIDSLTFAASNRPDGNRYFILLSDIADGVLEGRFQVNNMARNAWRFFYRYYPDLVEQAIGVPEADSMRLSDNYKLNLKIKDTRDLTRLFDENLDTLRNVNLRISMHAGAGKSDLRLQMPTLRYGTFDLQDIDITWNTEKDDGKYKLDIPRMFLSEDRELGHVHLSGNLSAEAITFAFNAEDTASIVEKVSLNGLLSTVDSLWQIQFNAAAITLFEEQWYMEEDNYLRFSSNYLETRNFELMNNLQRINVESYNKGRGLRFGLVNFDLNFLERLVKMEKLAYRGKIFNLDIEIEDVFEMKNMQGYVTTDTIFLNDIPFGALTGNAEMPDKNAPIWWRFFLKDKDKHELRVLGAYLSEDQKRAVSVEELGAVKPGTFQTTVKATNFPLKVLELFIPDISKTAGTLQVDAQLGGPFDKVGMQGEAIVDGHFQFDYLKAMFYIPNEKILLNERQIWADKDTILDGSQKNAAIIRGGLRHDHFNDWRLDCSIKSLGSNFMIMNTLPEDNAMYYGQGIGAFEAIFSGTFSKTDILVNATTGKETRLFIPLASASSLDVQDASFITFRKRESAQDEQGKAKTKNSITTDLKGLTFEMNVSVTDDAEVQLIFDAQAGDIVKGRGTGDIRMVINREGEFKMYGTYQIRRGEYMFTLLNWVNKPFSVNDGGTISWYGDPYGAQINLEAVYAENTSLYNLLREELEVTQTLNAEASKSTRAIVAMRLKGDLFKPNISFDLSFPNVSSQLKSMTDNKLSLLRQDQNELTRQVFGLIVIGSFLPPAGTSVNIQSSDYLASAFNTLTQVLSNQFSSYLTGLASEWFGGKVSSIEFDIAYNEYRNQVTPGQANLAQIGRELQVRLTSGFANDRITVQLGSQIGIGQPGTSNAEVFWAKMSRSKFRLPKIANGASKFTSEQNRTLRAAPEGLAMVLA
ncbi:MAG: translocation/assembly module TamB domain-containing protein [Lewinellaceae bacterium]|nr:translocation/assembly module TamB domain-containing protein [Lewinellaceae bacterium]